MYFSIILYGVITINNKMAQHVKSKNAIYAILKSKPLTININIGNYTIYLNDKVIDSIELPIINLGKNIRLNLERLLKM